MKSGKISLRGYRFGPKPKATLQKIDAINMNIKVLTIFS